MLKFWLKKCALYVGIYCTCRRYPCGRWGSPHPAKRGGGLMELYGVVTVIGAQTLLCAFHTILFDPPEMRGDCGTVCCLQLQGFFLVVTSTYTAHPYPNTCLDKHTTEQLRLALLQPYTKCLADATHQRLTHTLTHYRLATCRPCELDSRERGLMFRTSYIHTCQSSFQEGGHTLMAEYFAQQRELYFANPEDDNLEVRLTFKWT